MATRKQPARKKPVSKKPVSKKAPAKPTPPAKASPARQRHDVTEVIATLKKRSSSQVKKGMARYAIPSEQAFGVPVGVIRQLGKSLGKSHQLADELWRSGHYEARMLATFIDEVELLTPKQMDSWCKAFDNWAICDTACFALFDRSPHAFGKVKAWATRKPEFEKRAAFALLASLALHDKRAEPRAFSDCLPLVESAASDPRNFVKKAVSWALRGIGRRSSELNREAVALAQRLADSNDPAERWVGKDALRELTSEAVKKKLKAKPSA
ncbi:MAG TPA: DNA alkylation repair protein [Polyangiaceae bacterium]